MAQFKEPEIYERLKSLEIVDLDPSEFREEKLLEFLAYWLRPSGITAADMEEPLNEEKRLATLGSIDKAVVETASLDLQGGRGFQAVRTLSGVRSLSSLLLSATRPKDMEAGPAKAYYEGHDSLEKHFVRTQKNVMNNTTSPTNSIPYKDEGGPGYQLCPHATHI